jgi:hypothetical protein
MKSSLVLFIDETPYGVTKIDTDAGVKAWRIKKLDGQNYIVSNAQGFQCECGDFTLKREKRGELCKHLRAAIEVGLLPRPTQETDR